MNKIFNLIIYTSVASLFLSDIVPTNSFFNPIEKAQAGIQCKKQGATWANNENVAVKRGQNAAVTCAKKECRRVGGFESSASKRVFYTNNCVTRLSQRGETLWKCTGHAEIDCRG